MATLSQRVDTLATRVAQECRSLRVLLNGNTATLAGLNTTARGSLVAAINEVRATVVSVISDLQSIVNAVNAQAEALNGKLAISAKAVATDVWAFTSDTKYLTPKAMADAQAFSSITYFGGGTWSPDLAAVGASHILILSGNTFFGEFKNAKDGQEVCVYVIQDATGGRTLGINTTFHKTPGGIPPTASTTVNAVDRWTGICRGRGAVMTVEWSGYEKDIR